MTQLTMYSAQVNSPELFLTVAHDGATSTIWITGAVPNKLPAAPNLFIIGTDEDAETIFYPTAGVSVGGNNYRFDTVTRHFQGSSKAWDINTSVSRQYTAYDQNTFKNNIEDLVALRRIYDAFVYIDGTSAYAINRNGGTISSGTNHTTVMQAAIDYVNGLGGGEIYCSGTFTLTGLTIYSNIKLLGNVGGTSFNYSAMPTGVAINIDGNYGTTSSTIAVNASGGSTSITLSAGGVAALGLVDGDWIKIWDDTITPASTYKMGELHEIESITPGTEILILTTAIEDGYTIANNAGVRKITLNENISIEGIEFIGCGMDVSDVSYGIAIGTARNTKITRCDFHDWGFYATRFLDCIDSHIDSCNFKDIFLTGLGYSIMLNNASMGTVISNCNFRGKGRHYIATGGSSGTYLFGGWIKDVKIIGCYFESSTDEAINTHDPCGIFSNILVDSCIFNTCVKGIESQNANLIVKGCSFINCPIGVDVYNWGEVYKEIIILGNRFINTHLTATGRYGVYLEQTCNHITISDNFFYNTTITGGTNVSHIKINGNTFYKTSSAALNAIYPVGTSGNEGEYFDIYDNTFENWTVGYPIKMERIQYATVKNNLFKSCMYPEMQVCKEIVFDGNTFMTPQSYGCRFYWSVGNVYFINNTVNTTGTGVIEDGSATAGSQFVVDGNNFISVTTPIVSTTLPVSSPYTGLPYAYYVDKTIISQILSILGDCRLLISNNEITGVAIADLTRYTNNLTASSSVATWSGYKGKGVYYDFNGTSHVMRLTDAADENYFTFGNATAGSDTAFSIVAYIKRDASATDRAIVSKYNQDGLNREWIFYIAGATGYPTIQLFDESVDAYIGRRDSTALSTTEWKTLIMTYDGGEIVGGIQIYLDGVSVADATVTAGTYVAMENTTATLVVGGGGSTTPDYLWDGKIAFLAITAKALTADEAWSLNTLIKGMLG